MHGMYLISAADHTSVKCRRRPTEPPCTRQPRTCAVDKGGGGFVHAKQIHAASVAAAGRQRNHISMAQTLVT